MSTIPRLPNVISVSSYRFAPMECCDVNSSAYLLDEPLLFGEVVRNISVLERSNSFIRKPCLATQGSVRIKLNRVIGRLSQR